LARDNPNGTGLDVSYSTTPLDVVLSLLMNMISLLPKRKNQSSNAGKIGINADR
jgi:hypothetical protein